MLVISMMLSNLVGSLDVMAATVKEPSVNPVLYDATTISGGDLAKDKVNKKTVIATVHVTLKGEDGTVKATLEVTPKRGTTWKVDLPKGVKVAKGDTVTVYQQIGEDKSPEVTANAQPSKASIVTPTMPSGEIWIEQTSSNQVNKDEQAEAVEMFNKVNTAIAGDIESVKFSIDGTEHAYYEVTYTDKSTSGKVEATNLKIMQVTETSATPTIEKVQVTDRQIIVTFDKEVATGTKFYFIKNFTDGEEKNFCQNGNCIAEKSNPKEMSQAISINGKIVTFPINDDNDLNLGKEFDYWQVNSEMKKTGDKIIINSDTEIKAIYKYIINPTVTDITTTVGHPVSYDMYKQAIIDFPSVLKVEHIEVISAPDISKVTTETEKAQAEIIVRFSDGQFRTLTVKVNVTKDPKDKQIEDLNKDVEKLGKDLETKTAEVKTLTDKVTELKKQVSEKTAKGEADAKEIERLNKELAELKKQLEGKNTEVENLNNQIVTLKETVKTLEGKNTELTNNVTRLENEVKELKGKLETANNKILELTKENATLTERLKNKEEENAKLVADKTKLEEEKDKLAQEKDKLADNLKKSEEEKAKLQGEKEALEQQVAKLKEDLSKCPADQTEKVKELEKQIAEKENQIKEKEKDIAAKDVKITELSKALFNANGEIADLNEKLKRLESQPREKEYIKEYIYVRDNYTPSYNGDVSSLNLEIETLRRENRELKDKIAKLSQGQDCSLMAKERFVTIFSLKSMLYKTYLGDELMTQAEMMDLKGFIEPFISNNRTMLPLRYVALSLGLDVDWNHSTRTATFTNRDSGNALNPGKITINANTLEMKDQYGNNIAVDSKPMLKNGRFYISITNLTKAFGGTNGNLKDGVRNTIEWDSQGRRVLVYKYSK